MTAIARRETQEVPYPWSDSYNIILVGGSCQTPAFYLLTMWLAAPPQPMMTMWTLRTALHAKSSMQQIDCVVNPS
ncbi:hypothetical protein BDV26DRAFT_270892 [Aspergillus bertholletiae]|uniref:Uncharacterized protein n=1 Tax=Aspergillus bertholletiae TaxID=1226010 RepID=A0A5N7AY98_9EURO|nr:hypothetical protein BDV26DRAFT_270892 [Aspergillus bertholletiae]